MQAPTNSTTYLFQAKDFSLPKAVLIKMHKSSFAVHVMEVPEQTDYQFDGMADQTNFEDCLERQGSHFVIEYFIDGAGI